MNLQSSEKVSFLFYVPSFASDKLHSLGLDNNSLLGNKSTRYLNRQGLLQRLAMRDSEILQRCHKQRRTPENLEAKRGSPCLRLEFCGAALGSR